MTDESKGFKEMSPEATPADLFLPDTSDLIFLKKI